MTDPDTDGSWPSNKDISDANEHYVLEYKMWKKLQFSKSPYIQVLPQQQPYFLRHIGFCGCYDPPPQDIKEGVTLDPILFRVILNL